MPHNIGDLWWALVLLGLCAGTLSGALGVGSGIVLVPAMVLIFLLPQKSAQGTALAVMVPMALLGAIRYWRNPAADIDIRIVLLLTVGALVGVLLGTELIKHVSPRWIRKAFAVFMLIVAVRLLLISPKRNAPPTETGDPVAENVMEVKGSQDE